MQRTTSMHVYQAAHPTHTSPLNQDTPAEERLAPDGEFKPNLVNSVCYFVQVRAEEKCIRWLG